MITLHGFSQSGNTYKVALMLQALQLPWTVRHVPLADFAAGLTRSDAWRQGENEMGEVPILEIDGQRLTQSAAILLYLARREGRYGGATDDEQQDVLRWLFFDNHKFTSYFATYRFMKSFAGTPPEPALMAWFKGRIDNAFGIVDKHLAGREFIVGSAPTIADLSLAGYQFFPVEESGIDVAAQYPAIAAWRERLKTALPGWKPPYELLPGEQVLPRW
ncbi:glutathione S-transferase family protein [Roseateles sp. DXS20W]|uniref:Glutathione S-transferase family protein n=1 Tax=Pelomonas lactea TaxID=3299030 RepID=A0ABW7GEQ2_9BURK